MQDDEPTSSKPAEGGEPYARLEPSSVARMVQWAFGELLDVVNDGELERIRRVLGAPRVEFIGGRVRVSP